MSEALERFGGMIQKWAARVMSVPQRYAQASWIALLSVGEVLLELINSRLVPDIKRIKAAHLESLEAKTLQQKAEADRKVAEAAEAANRATLHNRNDALAQAEKELKAAEAAKTQAEAEAIRMDADTRRLEAVANAKAQLLDAISRLRQEGGEFFADKEDLEKLLDTRRESSSSSSVAVDVDEHKRNSE